MIYYKITVNGGDHGYIVDEKSVFDAVKSEVEGQDGLSVGDSVTVTAVEMTKDEYEALDEFSGW